MWDTNLPYIGTIPDSWKLALLGRFASEVQALNTDGAESNALQFKMGSIISKTGGDSKYHPETLEGYNVVIPGDIVINGLNLNYDLKSLRVGQVQEIGVITAAYITIRPHGINSGFLKYLLKGFDYIKTFHGMGKGIRLTLSYGELKKMFIPIPPVEVQQRVVDFLDAECVEIDTVVENTRASIEEYKKLKQSVITEAVTKGICGKRPMKETGVEWIGEIPAEWRYIKFGRVAKVASNLVDPADYPDYPQIAPDSIEKGSGKLLGDIKTVKDSNVISWNHLFHKGQIIYSKIRPLLNKLVIAPFDGLCSADMYPIETEENTPFFVYLMLSSYFLEQIKQVTEDRVKMPKVNQEELSSFRIVLPSQEEQQEIVAYLDEKCAAIDSLIASKEALIAELEAYKKSIIYEYVTGKKEV